MTKLYNDLEAKQRNTPSHYETKINENSQGKQYRNKNIHKSLRSTEACLNVQRIFDN